jgi:glucose-1-phosphate adenylyltransferase
MLADHASKMRDLTIGCSEVSLQDATAFGVMDVDANRRVKAL